MFRQAALAKLNSTEQLDSLMQVTTPKSWMAVTGAMILVGAALVWGILGRTAERVSGAGILLKEGGIFAVESRGAGIIEDVLVNVGDEVRKDQPLLRVTQRETSTEITQMEALLAELRANRDRSIELSRHNLAADLKSIAEEREALQAVAFIPLQGGRIQPGMAVQMSPEGVTWEEYGYMVGVVESINQGPSNPEAMNRLLRNQSLIQHFTAAGTVYEVKVRPVLDPTTPSGFKWTSRQGPPIQLGT